MKLESEKVEEKCKPSFEKHCALWGYKTELDEDGFYVDSLTQRLFNAYYDAWQASRAAIVVELPFQWVPPYEERGVMAAVCVLESLEQAGVSYK